MRILTNILLLLLLATLFSCSSKHQTPSVKHGTINLQNWDFKENGHIQLNGEWAFYWNTLFVTDTLQENQTEADTFVQFPAYWNAYKFDTKKTGANGFATYRIKLKINSNNQLFGIRIKNQATAYNLFLNGELIAQNGIVAENADSYRPEYKPVLVPVQFSQNENELILQIANFKHRRGGGNHPVILGLYDDVSDHRDMFFALDIIIIGIMLVMFIFFIGMFLFRKYDKASLIFALFCIIVLIRVSVTGERFLMYILPTVSWDVYITVEYLTFFFGPPVLLLFISKILTDIAHSFIIKSFFAISIVFALITLSTNSTFYTKLVPVYQAVIVMNVFYTLHIIIKAILRKKMGAYIILSGGIIMILAVINDMLYANSVIYSSYLTPVGFFFFIISYAYVLALNIYVVEKQKSKLETSLKTLSYLNKSGKKITSQLKLKTLIDTIYDSINLKTDVHVFCIGILNELNSSIDFIKPRIHNKIRDDFSLSSENVFLRGLFQEGKERISKEIHKEERDMFIPFTGIEMYKKIQSYILIPFGTKSKTTGIMMLFSLKYNAYDQYHLYLISTIASYTAIAIENTKALEQIELHREEIESQRDNIIEKNKELNILNTTKNKFFSIIAHDLRSPFSSILGFSDVLLNKHDTYNSEEREKIIQHIKKGTESAYALMENLFTWAMSQSEKVKFLPKEYNLRDVTDEVIETLTSFAQNKNIDLLNKIDPVILIYADDNMLRTILRNLISNSVKYSHKNSSISVSAKKNNKGVYLEVSDTGIGMTKAQKEKLFSLDINISSPGTDNELGSGLGLLLCKEFIEKHNGEITVESNPGQGSTFSFFLPDKINDEQI
jgi:signal transduction histidine kinase